MIVLSEVVRHVRWSLSPSVAASVGRAREVSAFLAGAGARLAARSNAVAHALTAMLKASGDWRVDRRADLPARRKLARAGLDWIQRRVELAEISQQHLDMAAGWWLRYYGEERHEQRSGCEDYLDAAWIAAPGDRLVVRNVVVDHGHLQFILGKRGVAVATHYLR